MSAQEPYADPATEVLADGGEVFRSPSGDGPITLRRQTFELMRTAANRGCAAAARTARENTLTKAVRERRISAASVPEWRARYNEAPAKTAQQIRAKPPGTVQVSAARAASTSSPASSGVVRDPESGQLTYLGVPVQSGGGEPQVFTDAGWMTVAAAKAAGVTADDLRGALHTVQFNPTGPMAQRYEQGPS